MSLSGECLNLTLRFAVLLVQLVQLRVVAVGVAALGGHVHNNQHVAPVAVQRDLVAVDVHGAKVVHGLGGGGGGQNAEITKRN